jgi:signal transduction histidine kinase
VIAAGGVAMAAAALDAFEYAWETLTGAPLVEMPEPWAELYGWSGFALRALVPIGFLAGALWERGGAGRLAPFAATIGRAATPEGLGDALRRALRDPSLEILRPATDGRWITESGGAVELPSPSGQRTVTLVERDGGRPLAAIVHDAALREHPELFDSVVAILRLALENEQLQAEVRGQLREVTESRARIVTAGEEERRRIERDLHDGAQQRLVAVLLRLQQARALAADPAVPDELQKGLDGIADELGHATRELRELARGIHPAILEEDGLGPAVAGLARRSTIPVDVEIDVGGRLPSAIESTAYFTIAESLTNAQRHAEAGRASVRLSRADGILSVEVDDDGRGGADPGRGSGLRGLDDRVTALGGHLEINSEPGRGTRVRASLPIP